VKKVFRIIHLGLALLYLVLASIYSSAFAAKVDTVKVFSKAMNKEVPAVIITPKSYQVSKGLPVLYLLHGYSDDHKKWVNTVPSIKELADKYNIIIVCPDGGYGSWYLDSPILKGHKYETFISTELVDFIDKNYKTNPHKEGRAITGLSMGGHGALLNAINHSEKYACAGSLSGAVNLLFESDKDNSLKDLKKDISLKLGDISSSRLAWQAHSIVYLIDKIKAANLPIAIDCGVYDFLIEDNRTLHKKLLQANVSHDYTERPGVHDWSYWANAIEYQVLFFSRIVQAKK
jgi:S-formylglutathione hydrolase FrmB